jgi:hypothetical protein
MVFDAAAPPQRTRKQRGLGRAQDPAVNKAPAVPRQWLRTGAGVKCFTEALQRVSPVWSAFSVHQRTLKRTEQRP